MKKHFLFFLFFGLLIVNFYRAQPALWAMTTNGGSSNAFGTIYSVSTGSNNLTTQYSFTYTSEGQSPTYNTFAVAPNGKLYGTTYNGGTSGVGVLYEYDIVTNNYVKKFDFGGTNGNYPNGSMIVATNGKLYGITGNGGATNNGVLYEFDPFTGVYTKKVDFAGASNGSYANGNLVQATNGKLYGLTAYGGANSLGVLFEYNITTNTLTKKIDFTGSATGSVPYGNLVQATNGKLYGLTTAGGASGNGVLFEYDPATNVFIKKANFNGTGKGAQPYGSLIQANNGKLYAMTKIGGTSNFGTIIEYDIAADTLIKKIDFNGSNGKWPLGDLMQSANGLLYGMTWQGNSKGQIYQYNPSTNGFTILYDFISGPGEYPYGNVIEIGNKLYGVTNSGGLKNKGVIFEYDLVSNTYTKKIDFNANINGGNPTGALLKTSGNKMYGFTSYGGLTNQGTLFEFDQTTNTLTKKVDFDNAVTKGSVPVGDLIEVSPGVLYGLASAGGTNNAGALFEYNFVANTFTKKIDFVAATMGQFPNASLLKANNGKLYSVTQMGGINTAGVIFEYDPVTNVCVKKFDFGTTNGTTPTSALVYGANGKLYGLTAGGGVNNKGVLYEYDNITNVFTKKIDFNGAGNGAQPFGDLVLANNNKFYGATYVGGANNAGVLFEYDPATNSFTKKMDFNIGPTTGSAPVGRLTLAGNGKLYGNTEYGGTNGNGVLFEYDPLTNNFVNVLSYGNNTPSGDMIEFCQTPLAANSIITATTQMCAGSTATIALSTNTISGANSYTWNVPATSVITSAPSTNSIILNISNLTAGIYTIDVSGTNTCGNGISSALTLTLNAAPVLTVNSGAVCTGQSFTINPSGASTYTYSGGTNIVSPLTTTNYAVTGTDANGCITSAVAISSITVNALPTLSITTNTSLICTGQSATLTVSGANTYSWNTASTNTSIVVSPVSNTTYTVTGTDANNCNNTAFITQSVSLCTGIEKQNEGRFITIYPNPSNGIFNISCDCLSSNNNLEIYNTLGQIIFSQKNVSDKLELDLSKNPPGLYYLKWKTETGEEIKKVIKE